MKCTLWEHQILIENNKKQRKDIFILVLTVSGQDQEFGIIITEIKVADFSVP